MQGFILSPKLIYISGLKLFVNPKFFGQKQGLRNKVGSEIHASLQGIYEMIVAQISAPFSEAF